jgi:succinate dehydrogenase / fumarate reductase cytochrome b subunit
VRGHAGFSPARYPAVYEDTMSWFVTYVRSSIGAKHIMAVTGLALVLFAIVHMIGHFGMFGGPDAYNSYAHFLQSLGALKWLARGGLLAVFVVHIVAAIAVSVQNRAARPVKYAVYRTKKTNIMARTMAITGLALFAFIGFHLVHFTFGLVQPEFFHLSDTAALQEVPAVTRPDAYAMFVWGFRNVPLYVIYLLSIALLASHLGHGASSWLQSLGFRHPKYNPLFEKLGPVVSLVLFVGYMAPPTAVLLGMITL